MRFDLYQARLFAEILDTFAPSKNISPLEGVSMKPKMCMRVDLPEPEAPKITR